MNDIRFMDTPQHFPSNDHFHELTYVYLGDFGQHGQGLVHVRGQLEAHVLPFETHSVASQAEMEWAAAAVRSLWARCMAAVIAEWKRMFSAGPGV